MEKILVGLSFLSPDNVLSTPGFSGVFLEYRTSIFGSIKTQEPGSTLLVSE